MGPNSKEGWCSDIPWANTVLLPTMRDVLPPFPMANKSFLVITDEMTLGATIPLKSVDEDEHHVYKTLFENLYKA